MRIRPGETESSHHIRSGYAEAVIEAGGLPLYLPVTRHEHALRRYAALLDGLMLTGDADIPPEAYGEKPHPLTKAMPGERYESEKRLIELWLQGRKPLFGICMGCQFVNVLRGGSLVQDIPSQAASPIAHRREEGEGDASHAVFLEPRTLLSELFGKETGVNSSHHQAVERIGAGLRLAARAEDGLIEALEMPDYPWALLVQWHPERMEDAEHRRILFGAFIRACADGRQKKAGAPA